MGFLGGQEGHTSHYPNGLVRLRRPNIGGEIFWLSTLKLKDIPYNGDFRETLDRVSHVEYVLSNVAVMSKTVATFVQKLCLIWLKSGFLLKLFRIQM